MRANIFNLNMEEYNVNLDTPNNIATMLEYNTTVEEIALINKDIDLYTEHLSQGIESYEILLDQYETNKNKLENRRISNEDIYISNECIATQASVLGFNNKYRYSTESDMTNYELLTLSNEGIIDFIKALIKKIKDIFLKIWNFFKDLFIKILRFLGIIENDVESKYKEIKSAVSKSSNEDFEEDYAKLRIKFNNILNKNPLDIQPKTLLKILKMFPPIVTTYYKANSFKDMVNYVNVEEILKPITSGLAKTMDKIKQDTLLEGDNNKHLIYDNLNTNFMKDICKYIMNAPDNDLDKDEVPGLITNINNPITFIVYNKEKHAFTGYKEVKYETPDLETMLKDKEKLLSSISAADIDLIYNKLMKDFIPKEKKFSDNIKKLHELLQKVIEQVEKEIDKDNDKINLQHGRDNLKFIQMLGTKVVSDMNNFLYTSIRRFHGMMGYIYEDLKHGTEINYHRACEVIKQTYPDCKVKYLFGNKDMIYLDPGNDFWNIIYEEYGIGFALIGYNVMSDINKILLNIMITQKADLTPEYYKEKQIDISSLIFIDELALSNGIIERMKRYREQDKKYTKQACLNIVSGMIGRKLPIDSIKNGLEYASKILPDGSSEEDIKLHKKGVIDSFLNTIAKKDSVYHKDTNIKSLVLDLVLNFATMTDESIEKDILKNIYKQLHNKFTMEEKAFIYYHELGHVIMRQAENPMYREYDQTVKDNPSLKYVRHFTELEADAYAMLKTGMSLDQTVMFRCIKLMPHIANYQDEYRKNVSSPEIVDHVKQWITLGANSKILKMVTSGLKLKDKLKNYENLEKNKTYMPKSSFPGLLSPNEKFEDYYKRIYDHSLKLLEKENKEPTSKNILAQINSILKKYENYN